MDLVDVFGMLHMPVPLAARLLLSPKYLFRPTDCNNTLTEHIRHRTIPSTLYLEAMVALRP
jgi:hypothetical protein